MQRSKAVTRVDRAGKLLGMSGLLGLAGLAGLADPMYYHLSALSFLSYLACFRFFKFFFGGELRLSGERIPILFFVFFVGSGVLVFLPHLPVFGFLGLFGFLGYALDPQPQPERQT